MANKVILVFFILFLHTLMTLIHIGAMAHMARHFRCGLSVFSLFFGPRLMGYTIDETDYRLSLIPLGGYIRFQTEEELSLDENMSLTFESLSKWRKILIASSGPIALFITACMCLRLDHAANELFSGFSQIIEGTIRPLSVGKNLLARYFEILGEGDWLKAFGVLAAKFAAFNMLPLSTLNGGQILRYLFQPGKATETFLTKSFDTIGILLSFVIFLCWSIALLTLLING